jgi:hypothetical protein
MQLYYRYSPRTAPPRQDGFASYEYKASPFISPFVSSKLVERMKAAAIVASRPASNASLPPAVSVFGAVNAE